MDAGDYANWGSGLLQAYLSGEYKPVVKQASKEALTYGAKNIGWDWLAKGGNVTPAGSGLIGGGATLLTGLLTGETDDLAGKTLASGGGAYFGNAMAQQAIKGYGNVAPASAFGGMAKIGGTPALASATGALGGGVASGMYELATKGKLSKGTEWSTIGGAVGSIFGPVGALAGSMIGGLVASAIGADGPKLRKGFKFDRGRQGVYFNEETGQFEAAKILDAALSVDSKGYNLSPQQKAKLAQEKRAQVEKELAFLNDSLGRMAQDQTPVGKQRMQDFISMFNQPIPGDDELRAKYDNIPDYLKKNVSFDKFKENQAWQLEQPAVLEMGRPSPRFGDSVGMGGGLNQWDGKDFNEAEEKRRASGNAVSAAFGYKDNIFDDSVSYADRKQEWENRRNNQPLAAPQYGDTPTVEPGTAGGPVPQRADTGGDNALSAQDIEMRNQGLAPTVRGNPYMDKLAEQFGQTQTQQSPASGFSLMASIG